MQSSVPRANGSAKSETSELAEVKKEAAKVTKKLLDVNEKLDNIDGQITMITYIGLGIVSSNFLLLILFLFFS